MKNLLAPFGLVLGLICILTACDRMQEAQNSYHAVVASTEAVKNLGATLERAESNREARVASGDTMALSYKELEKYLPREIAGFSATGTAKGESVSMGGLSYSTCEQVYQKGAQNVKVQLIDYNGANALYAGATAMMTAGFSQENDEQMMRGCDLGLDGVKGWETLQKREHKAALALGVGDRFFVTVESEGQDDTNFVKEVAHDIDLAELAKL